MNPEEKTRLQIGARLIEQESILVPVSCAFGECLRLPVGEFNLPFSV